MLGNSGQAPANDGSSSAIPSSSRKNRAIGLLTTRILSELPDYPEDNESWEVCVEQVVKRLNASRGAVYEIFHVFESLLLVTKIGTNTYKWNGYGQMNQTLAFLRLIAIMLDLPSEMRRVRDHEVSHLIQDPIDTVEASTPNEKTHILRVCQKFVMLFLIAQQVVIFRFNQHFLLFLTHIFSQPKTMSLEFASKVIHGIDTPDSVLKSRTRRLYDISNGKTSLSSLMSASKLRLFFVVLTAMRHPLVIKVNMTSLSSPRKTALQYRGPDVECVALTPVDVMSLPDYRRKHLYFDQGKAMLGIPERPLKISRLTTVRLRPVEDAMPQPVEPLHGGLHLDRMAVADLKWPLCIDYIAQLEAMRLNVKLKKNSAKDQQETFDTMWMAILPGQESVMQCFEVNKS